MLEFQLCFQQLTIRMSWRWWAMMVSKRQTCPAPRNRRTPLLIASAKTTGSGHEQACCKQDQV
ncbi:MAG: hypothetical protein H6975_04370 [Gammaproteobacteria bacterium]|nr:hypothetical protein [Gammaproteobacteria bacterium]